MLMKVRASARRLIDTHLRGCLFVDRVGHSTARTTCYLQSPASRVAAHAAAAVIAPPAEKSRPDARAPGLLHRHLVSARRRAPPHGRRG